MTPDLIRHPPAGRCAAAVLLLAASLANALSGDALAATAGASSGTLAPARPAPSAVPASPGADPSAGAGERLAQEGNAQGGNACMACHGPQGEGNAAGGIPRLAGLPAQYLEKQLQDFTTDARPSPVMSTIANSLGTAQRQQVARYYAALQPPDAMAKPAPQITAKPSSRGRTLIETGDNRLQVQACSNCHGPGATGIAGTAIPYLAGQQAGYLRNALAAWREGRRNNDPSQQMPVVARRLRPEDIDALLAYLGATE